MIVKYLIIQRVTVKNWFCTFLLAKKGTQKRHPQSIYSPIAGRSLNQQQFFGSTIFSNPTLRTESLNIFCNFIITVIFFNSTNVYKYII